VLQKIGPKGLRIWQDKNEETGEYAIMASASLFQELLKLVLLLPVKFGKKKGVIMKTTIRFSKMPSLEYLQARRKEREAS
jgi:hypothetical protein